MKLRFQINCCLETNFSHCSIISVNIINSGGVILKKNVLKSITVFIFITLFSTVIFAAGTQGFSGNVAEIDKYGNVRLDVTEEAVKLSGVEIGDILEVRFNDKTLVLPFATAYGDVDRSAPLIRLNKGFVQMAINYGNFATFFSVALTNTVNVSVLEKGSYKAQIELRKLVKSEERKDYLSDQAFANFREVSMGWIKPGILFRTSHPSVADSRSSYVAKFVQDYQIKTIINLADTQAELQDNIKNSKYYEDLYNDGSVIALGMGVDLLSKDFAGKLKTAFEFMIDHKGPYAIHCLEGKDRAGIVSAILEGLMGATVDEIINDYMITYENYYSMVKGTERYDLIAKIMTDQLKEMNSNKPVTDLNLRSVMFLYLKNTVGLSEEQIALLRTRLSN